MPPAAGTWEREMAEAPKVVGDVMTQDVFTLEHNEKLSVADDVMRLGRIRHIPVVDDDGAVVGVVSQRDLFFNALLRALGYGSYASQKTLEEYRVKDAMHEPVITCRPNTPLSEAARTMLEKKIGCLPVVEDGQLVGIVTESDFVALIARGG